MNLKDLAKTVHAANIKWWQDVETGQPIKRNKGELLALIHSEISEAYDGDQSGLLDDKLPHRKMPEVEMTDAAIRILDYAAGFNHDIYQAGLKYGLSEFIDLDHLIKCANVGCLPATVGYSDIHSQISKVLELERKSKPSIEVAESLVFLLLLIFLVALELEYEMQDTFDEKMEYNRTREDHKHEARRIAGGKQF